MVAATWAPPCQKKGVGLDVSRLTWVPAPAQPEQLLRSDEHCRALQGRGYARLGPPINAGPRLLAPQPGPGGPQLPRRHPIAVCDPYAFLHWRKVWANRQLYWFRSASMRLHSAAYGLSVTSWRRAKGLPSRATHSKSLRASLSRPCSRAMSELQVFQGSCGRNEHRIRAQHWGPGARPFTTRSHFILEVDGDSDMEDACVAFCEQREII
ncbi:uncharacterized protein LOC120612201 [Pteropus medius]|uniref:uncharacterized protein LOC120612201 n=1 Tax=Pteropus vampyrus TaxID=132908 RepID=UPI00196B99D5|nr:uncharacterized protein LOC120612201 [Pteropus giganteus]